MYKKLIIINIITISLFADINKTYINMDDINVNRSIELDYNNYKILNFKKRISDIRLSNSENLSINFEDDNTNPLSTIKVFAKKLGKINALIRFDDNSIKQINFIITPDLRSVKLLINAISTDIKIEQINETIVLKGIVKNNKIKDKVLLILENTVKDIKIINLLKIDEPDKMVRLKLYVSEIDNVKGETYKNNWSFESGLNNGDTTLNVQTSMLNAVTLSGGLTAVANNLGSNFNTGLTLNYLKTNGVAKILDETTLLTLEKKDSKFLAGGTLLIQTSTTSAEGQPVSSITEVNYGLELNIKVEEIINDKYVKLEIDTSSSTLDHANGVGEMPAKKDKKIITNVVIENDATVVLGGLINNNYSKNFDKIPFLSDIPILGKLFQSKAFNEGKSELVFFITPTIVDPKVLKEQEELESIKGKIIKKKKIVVKKAIKMKTKEELTNEELHKQRLKNIFNID
ncbi:MAG: hypothetical protein U9Q20_05115 [Campylobacterota bacterium]|nr:hypothetical protein [Campylobacterota bacterium]